MLGPLIHCLQINLQHGKAASSLLHGELAASAATYIALIQEPYCPFGRVCAVPQNSFCHVGKKGARVRAAVLVSKDVTAITLHQFSDEDCVAVLVEISTNGGKRNMVFCSLYLPFDSPEPPPTENFTRLVEYCEGKGYGLIVGSDTNAHHTAWGSSNCNNRGEALFQYIMSTNLDFCNQGTKPTFVTRVRREVLDVTFASMRAIGMVKNWRVDDSHTYSDHKRLSFQIQGGGDPLPSFRNYRRTDWNLFQSKLVRRLENLSAETQISSTDEIEELTERVTNAIQKSADESCRLIRPKKRKSPPWWSSELKALHREANRLNRRWKRQPTEENHNLLKEMNRSFKREVRKAKRETWASFCTKVNSLPAAARLNLILKRGARDPQGTMKRPDGTFTETPEETIDLLLQSHFPDLPVRETNVVPMGPYPKVDGLLNGIITEERVEESFKSFSPYKASGPDGVIPILAQEGIRALKGPLTALFKACLNLGYVPSRWRRARVVFLPKPGKDDYSSPKSYRPISLTSFLLKGLERLVYWYLVENPLEGRVFHQYQFAYRPGRSTVDALHTIVTRLEKALFNKEVAIAAFLDIEGAFNNARVSSMVSAVLGRDVPLIITRWISTLLESREVEATMLGKTRQKVVMKGCPQGGILSPLLWNLVMDSLLAINENQPGIHCQAYADDVTVLQSGPVASVVANRLQDNLNWLETWAETHNMSFSPAKTVIIMFTRKTRVAATPLFLNGEQLTYLNRVKHLGIILDHHLTWTPHIKAATRKAQNSLAQCRRAVGLNWGVTPKSMMWLYKAVIRPIIEYACLIWNPALKLGVTQKLLSKLQRAALLSITGAYPSTPTRALEVLLNIPPLHIFLLGSATQMAHALRVKGCWEGDKRIIGNAKSHIDTANRLLNESPVFKLPVDKLKEPVRIHDRPFKVEIPKRESYQGAGPEFDKDLVDEIYCFTDGSKTDKGTGVGIVINGTDVTKNISIPFCQLASVYQMEVAAISILSRELIQSGVTNKTVLIFTDSQAAAMALSGNRVYTKGTWECIESLKALSSTNRVIIKWIPAHRGFKGNEAADTLAKKGSDGPFVGPTPSLPISLSTVKGEVKEIASRKNAQEWRARNDCRQTKMFLPSPRPEAVEELMGLRRPELRDVIQIITGHANLARHRHLSGKTASPLCRFCRSEEETASHHIARCPRYGMARLQNLYCIRLEEDQFPSLRLRGIVAFNKATKRLADFGDP